MLNKLFFLVSLFLLFASTAKASGTVTGTLTSPTTSVPVPNASLTFTLSQSGVDVSNTYALSTTPVTCATGSDGVIVGIKNPLLQAVAAASNGAGSLSGTYYLVIEYVNLAGQHTLGSPVVSINVTGPNNAITFTAPTLHPFSAVGYKIYVGTVSGTYHLQTTVSGWGTYVLTSYNASGGPPVINNTTTCTFTFNDAIIPSYTTYNVSISNVNGSNVGGFPQTWYLQGSSVNIANILPVTNQSARFPTPILANPLSSYAVQSINSPLTLNGYALNVGTITDSGDLSVSGNLNIGNDLASSILKIGLLGNSIGRQSSDGTLVIYGGQAAITLGTQGGGLILDFAGHFGTYLALHTPTVAIDAGTASMISGSTDNAGKILVNNSAASIITMTFGAAYATAPVCIALNMDDANIVKSSTSTSQLIITGTTVSGDKIAYICNRFGS